jgi:hypothetical protein
VHILPCLRLAVANDMLAVPAAQGNPATRFTPMDWEFYGGSRAEVYLPASPEAAVKGRVPWPATV